MNSDGVLTVALVVFALMGLAGIIANISLPIARCVKRRRGLRRARATLRLLEAEIRGNVPPNRRPN